MKSALLSTIFFSSLVGIYSRGFRGSVSRNTQMGLTRPNLENVTIPNLNITIPGVGGTLPGQGDMNNFWEGLNITEVNATEISSLNLTDSIPLPSDIGIDEETANEILEEATAVLDAAEEMVENMTPDEAEEIIGRFNQTLVTTQEELQQTYQNITQDEVITMAQTVAENVQNNEVTQQITQNVQNNAVVQQVGENIAENVQNTIPQDPAAAAQQVAETAQQVVGNATAVGTQVAENLADRVENSGVDSEAVEAAVQDVAEQARTQLECRQDCVISCGETTSTIRAFTRCNQECVATCL